MSRVRRSASDEVDDLQPVSIVQWSLRPLVAGHDLAVQFDRYAVRLHAEPLDERAQSFGGGDLVLAIDREVHQILSRILRPPGPSGAKAHFFIGSGRRG